MDSLADAATLDADQRREREGDGDEFDELAAILAAFINDNRPRHWKVMQVRCAAAASTLRLAVASHRALREEVERLRVENLALRIRNEEFDRMVTAGLKQSAELVQVKEATRDDA